MEQYREQLKQQRGDGVPSRQREGNRRQTLKRTRRTEWGSRKPKGTSRPYMAILTLSPVTTSIARCSMLCSEALGTSPPIVSSRTCAERWRWPRLPQGQPHHRWMETSISFGASDYPKSMAGAGQLPLLVSPTSINIKLYHVLIDSGAALNLISLAAFKKL
jgi:hypothetical protein